jgi:D-alanine-D-alanine ligase
MTTSRVLLLSPIDRSTTPDMDLTSVIADLLIALRHQPGVRAQQAQVDSLAEVERAIRLHRPDVVFNACETLAGKSHEEPLVPQLLDRLAVPFTGNTAQCLRRCLHKAHASEILRTAGVTVPAVFRVDAKRGAGAVPRSAYPVIVKPESEDGSVGIGPDSVVHDEAELERTVAALADRGQPAFVQQYVEGRELAVAFLGWPEPRVLPPGEIFYDAAAFAGRTRILTYASKWDPSSPDYHGTHFVAARLRPGLLARLSAIALRAAGALGMRDYGRIDFRLDAEGRPFVIDANPNCDLSSDGGFMRAAARAQLSYEATVGAILVGAVARASGSSTRRAVG